jgi:DNA (cytosine-5)-methyltransferase 1
MKKLRLIDAFCGAGGFTRGFLDTRKFEVVFANDWDDAAMETYRANFDMKGDHSYNGDIVEFLKKNPEKVPEADVVIGGPPCQGFSLLNKARIGDPRRDLWKPYVELVRLSGADVFVMENVIQLLNSYELEDLRKQAKEMGFDFFEGRKLCAADYGVPQERYRAVVIASRIGPVDFPVQTHLPPEHCIRSAKSRIGKLGTKVAKRPQLWNDVRSAIGDLLNVPTTGLEIREDLGAPLNLHFGRTPTATSMERYKAVPPGGNRFDLLKNRPDITPCCWIRKKTGGTDLFGRLWWDRPSVTIRTEFFKPEKGRYLHPELHRPITHREAARIQSFPDSYKFKGTKIQIAKQIGNAVPPLLAMAIGRAVAEALATNQCVKKSA